MHFFEKWAYYFQKCHCISVVRSASINFKFKLFFAYPPRKVSITCMFAPYGKYLHHVDIFCVLSGKFIPYLGRESIRFPYLGRESVPTNILIIKSRQDNLCYCFCCINVFYHKFCIYYWFNWTLFTYSHRNKK